MDILILVSLIAAIIGSLTALAFLNLIPKDEGTDKMKEVASHIREGAYAFLKREFKTITTFAVPLAAILLIAMWPNWRVAFGFALGTIFSLIATALGMNAATRANLGTAEGTRSSWRKAFQTAFQGGAVMGLAVIALNLLGVTLLAIIFGVGPDNTRMVSSLVGFGFGASLSALFAQLGGGIYTKGADVGADLVGKVESKIPEDDPRNPAVIADLVGDNVGDCAGRGADLFESGADNIISLMILGAAMFVPTYGWPVVAFPLLVHATGTIGTIIGAMITNVIKVKNATKAVLASYLGTAVFSLISFFLLTYYLMGEIKLFYCLLVGLVAAVVAFLIVEFYTSVEKGPVKAIAEAAKGGHAINIITGFSYGLESVALPALLIVSATLGSYYIMGGGFSGILGIATAVLGLTEMKGIIMASDAFGPIADNAQGIAEMAGVGENARRAGEELDAVGNMTKALTKGYSMLCALLTGVVIMFAYLSEAAHLKGIELVDLSSISINLINPVNICALLLGATVPFLFSALAIRGVGKTAAKMVDEVRRQFKEIPGILKGTAEPDYARCVDISTQTALKEMIGPTLLGTVVPVVIGFTLGVWPLAAYLIATKLVGALLATFMFNSGGAWDNAKKYIEAGNLGGKGTDTHAAAVTGDTFGDPLKDTAGPSLHILIKLQNILSITLLPLFIKFGG